MLKIEDLIRKSIIIEEVAGNKDLNYNVSVFWDSHDLLNLMTSDTKVFWNLVLWDSHDLLKLMKEILSLAA